MNDKIDNTLITIMIILGVIIAVILLAGGSLGRNVGYYQYGYQQANTLGAFDDRGDYRERYYPIYTDTVTSYSRPSRYTTFGNTEITTTTTTNREYEKVYSYTCQDGYCWTNQ